MARGWESKAVADQMEEASDIIVRPMNGDTHRDSSPAARARRERRESLKLSRARTLDQLERATNETHRTILQRTLRALERELEATNESA
jgi:hypothetical protein